VSLPRGRRERRARPLTTGPSPRGRGEGRRTGPLARGASARERGEGRDSADQARSRTTKARKAETTKTSERSRHRARFRVFVLSLFRGDAGCDLALQCWGLRIGVGVCARIAIACRVRNPYTAWRGLRCHAGAWERGAGGLSKSCPELGWEASFHGRTSVGCASGAGGRAVSVTWGWTALPDKAGSGTLCAWDRAEVAAPRGRARRGPELGCHAEA
jgi:hypothetical protein